MVVLSDYLLTFGSNIAAKSLTHEEIPSPIASVIHLKQYFCHPQNTTDCKRCDNIRNYKSTFNRN